MELSMERQQIVVVSPKGGNGKTTLTTHLAAMHEAKGGKVLIIDTDPIATSSIWCQLRSSPNIIFERLDHSNPIQKPIDILRAKFPDHMVLIDNTGGDSKALRSAIDHPKTNTVLITSRPSKLDLISSRAFALELATHLSSSTKKLRAVLMSVDPLPCKARRTLEVKDGFKSFGITPLNAITYRRDAYEKNFLKGGDAFYDPKAERDIKEIYDEVLA
jgi:chromosome partitioning protein